MRSSPFINSKIISILKAVLFCLLFTVLFMGLSFFKKYFPANSERPAHAILGIIAALLILFLFLWFDKKTFSGIGLRLTKGTPLHFIRGFFAGVVLMGLLSISVIYCTGFTIALNAKSNLLSFLWVTLPLLPLAFMEELAFRTYPLRVINDASGIRVSILVTSLLFALYHLANGWTFQNSFLGAGSWGIIFGAAAIYSSGIAMSTGLHYAVNLIPAAFGLTENGTNLWILKLRSGAPAESYTESRLAELIPQLCVLLTGLFFIEWLMRSQQRKS